MSATRLLTHEPERVVPLDGGLGTRLESRGNDVSTALWSAQLLRDDPDEVVAAHVDYFRAGARVATTCSYQVSADGLAGVMPAEDAPVECERLLRLSVEVARTARELAGLGPDDAWIAASVGPFGASRADGSEYTGDYGLNRDELRRWHRARIRTLASAGADVLLCETIPSLDEVAAITDEIAALETLDGIAPPPAIISVTVADGKLRSGESIADAVRLAESCDALAVGVNCCTVDDATKALRIMSETTSLPLIAYPNSGEVWDAESRSWSGSAHAITDAVDEWVSLGARFIGGCCRVDTAEIGGIATQLSRVAR